MLGRYFGSSRAPLRLIGDAVAELGEETIDATIRGKLEDGDAAVSFDQFREIAMGSGLGGFTKTGLIAEMIRGNRTNPPSEKSPSGEDNQGPKLEPPTSTESSVPVLPGGKTLAPDDHAQWEIEGFVYELTNEVYDAILNQRQIRFD